MCGATGEYLQTEAEIQYLLNAECKSALKLGIGFGLSVDVLCKLNWLITGYDYSTASCDYYADHASVKVKRINLDEVDNNRHGLVYYNELEKDLQKPTNIIAINILPYLEIPSLCLLMSALIQLAKPGSVFFIKTIYSNLITWRHFSRQEWMLSLLKWLIQKNIKSLRNKN